MAGNSNLHDSLRNKQNEFYTQLTTIENELRHYRKYFKGKVIFCNADDPAIGEDGQNHYGDGLGAFESQFFKYFRLNFLELGIKKLITTHYVPNGQSYKFEIVSGDNGDQLGLPDYIKTPLKGNGDFRSQECIDILKNEADIVVTNPPFSLMKEYLPLLINSGKHFIVLGNINHAVYKEIFPYIIERKLWLGHNAGHFWFMVPDDYEPKATDYKQDETGQKWRRMGNICWFTNLDIEKRHQPIDLYKRYNSDEFPTYDNYDAIHVVNTRDIPEDYAGIISVPVTYLPYHCDEQFELIGELKHGIDNKYDFDVPILHGIDKFTRLLIRNRNPKNPEDYKE